MPYLQYLWFSRKAILLCIPPILYFMGGLSGQLASWEKLSLSRAWRVARTASTASLGFSLACSGYALWQARSLARGPRIESIVSFGHVHLSVRFDLIESLMLLLVTFLGWVIVNYSRGYMAGDPKESLYITRFMHTLASVTLLVMTNSLIVFLIAWVLTGLALHGLLTLYPTRQAAVIVAHKKFLASRLGDFTLLCGVLLLAAQTGSFEMNEVADHIAKLHQIPLPIHVAALLLAISAIIKSAQFPLHGWLIQVMEAPTPVSALLHAGVVNLGGFMLIRLAPVINTTQAAQALLVAVGCLTATIGSLVMTTRISIKVHLAWSTCAQMGFMLMECGLGLYDLAFLHLLAHSLYKANEFLGSGRTVTQGRVKLTTPPRPMPKLPALLGGGLCGLLVAILSAVLWQPDGRMDAALIFCITIVGLALAGILASVLSNRSIVSSVILLMSAIAVSAAYFGEESLFLKIMRIATFNHTVQRPMLIFSLGCFVVLYGIQTMVRIDPMGKLATALYQWFYAGLYLDEVFTRATFRLWPANRLSKGSQRRDAMQPFEVRGESL